MEGRPKVLDPRPSVIPRGINHIVPAGQFPTSDGGSTARDGCIFDKGFKKDSKSMSRKSTWRTTKPQYSKTEKTHHQRLTKPSPKPFERTANSVTPRHARPCGEPCTWLHPCEQNPRKTVAWSSPANLGQFETCRKQARGNGQKWWDP